MTRTIRRTIVVEYPSSLSLSLEKTLNSPEYYPSRECFCAEWPVEAEIRETVEEITEENRG